MHGYKDQSDFTEVRLTVHWCSVKRYGSISTGQIQSLSPQDCFLLAPLSFLIVEVLDVWIPSQVHVADQDSSEQSPERKLYKRKAFFLYTCRGSLKALQRGWLQWQKRKGGAYESRAASMMGPFLPPAHVNRFKTLCPMTNELTHLRQLTVFGNLS